MTNLRPPTKSRASLTVPSWWLVLQAVIGLGTAAWMAHFVDAGLTRPWTTVQQGAWFLGMLLALSVGSRAAIALWRGDTRFAWLPFILLAFATAAIALAALLQSWLGLRFWSGFFGSLAVIQAWCTWQLPWWFWEGWRARWLRSLIGDRATRIVCGTAALLLAIAAIKVAKV